jgi:hypothetical protein
VVDQDIVVLGPQVAGDAILDFLRANYGRMAPTEGMTWVEDGDTSDDLVGASDFQYYAGDWVVTVSFSLVAPEATIYEVDVFNQSNSFRWSGTVDAYGKVRGVLLSGEDQDVEPTEEPTRIPTLVPTQTPLPTSTPMPTPIPFPSPTPLPIPCEWAKFVSDVTVADGRVFTSGSQFIKTWRLKNIGTCTWTKEYDLVFVGGYNMEGGISVSLPDYALPGESVDVSVTLTAPEVDGNYTGHWMLRNAHGVLFGIGGDANSTFWVNINVVEPNVDFSEDFATNRCVATWTSAAGVLPCLGKGNRLDGFVKLLNAPELENRLEDEPTLWVRPNNQNGGWVKGVYPEIEVKEGDRFRAWVGCLDDSDRCDVTFKFDYSIDGGPVRTIMQWREISDGEVTKVDLLLNEFAGKKIQIILTVISNSDVPADQNAFWFVPRIENVDDPYGID